MSLNDYKSKNDRNEKDTGLHYSEITFYSLIWVGGVVYSIYRVYLKSQEFGVVFREDLDPGWSFLNTLKDNVDSEWNTYLNIAPAIIFTTICILIIGDVISLFFNREVIRFFHITSSTLFSIYFFGLIPTAALHCQYMLFYFSSRMHSKALVWGLNFLILLLLNNNYFNETILGLFHIPEKYILWCITVAWNNLRGTSFGLEAINFYQNVKSLDEYNVKYSLLNCFAYCGFLPTLITGPFVLYDTFESGFVKWADDKAKKYKNLVCQLGRYTFWLLLTEFSLHFLYTNAMELYPWWVNKLSSWEMYGYGYLLGQFFLLKYVVIYGISGALIRSHGVDAPRTPKCIARIHRYSDMWRYFDPGLHSFLFRYVYLPSRNLVSNYSSNRLTCKIASSFFCFAYIYVWHGTNQYILLWSILNYLAVSIETICDAIEASSTYRRITKKYLTHDWQLRLNSAMTCPLLAMSAISNFYFFAGLDIGNIFLIKFVFADWKVNLTLFGFLYSACNVSHKIKVWENNRVGKNKVA